MCHQNLLKGYLPQHSLKFEKILQFLASFWLVFDIFEKKFTFPFLTQDFWSGLCYFILCVDKNLEFIGVAT